MTKKELRYSFNKVLDFAESLRCEQLSLSNKQLHKSDEVCFAEYEIHKHCHIVREYAKAIGII